MGPVLQSYLYFVTVKCWKSTSLIWKLKWAFLHAVDYWLISCSAYLIPVVLYGLYVQLVHSGFPCGIRAEFKFAVQTLYFSTTIIHALRVVCQNILIIGHFLLQKGDYFPVVVEICKCSKKWLFFRILKPFHCQIWYRRATKAYHTSKFSERNDHYDNVRKVFIYTVKNWVFLGFLQHFF